MHVPPRLIYVALKTMLVSLMFSLPIHNAIFTRNLRTCLSVLVKFHIDSCWVFAPDLPAIIGTDLFTSSLDAIFRQLFFDRIDVLNL